MIKKRIAINGFGRIGKIFLRTIFSDPEALKNIEVAAINIGPAESENLDLLFKYDSSYGEFPAQVSYKNQILNINNHEIKVLAQKDPTKISWKELKVDWIIESSGKFTNRKDAQLHLNAGAKKVIITAPANDEDVVIIVGVNDRDYNSNLHNVISLGSCTTNCFAPIIKVLKENFTLVEGMMTTVHAYTNDQVLLDVEHKDPRRARAAAVNIIPTKTGADKVITKIYPEFTGKLKSSALRVPTTVVSIIDFTFIAEQLLTKEKINQIFKEYAAKNLAGILDFIEKPLVSSDFKGNKNSCIIDGLLTESIGKVSKIFAWYDNEFGYCCRIKDFLLHN